MPTRRRDSGSRVAAAAGTGMPTARIPPAAGRRLAAYGTTSILQAGCRLAGSRIRMAPGTIFAKRKTALIIMLVACAHITRLPMASCTTSTSMMGEWPRAKSSPMWCERVHLNLMRRTGATAIALALMERLWKAGRTSRKSRFRGLTTISSWGLPPFRADGSIRHSQIPSLPTGSR
jgi:hypothetical protein